MKYKNYCKEQASLRKQCKLPKESEVEKMGGGACKRHPGWKDGVQAGGKPEKNKEKCSKVEGCCPAPKRNYPAVRRTSGKPAARPSTKGDTRLNTCACHNIFSATPVQLTLSQLTLSLCCVKPCRSGQACVPTCGIFCCSRSKRGLLPCGATTFQNTERATAVWLSELCAQHLHGNSGCLANHDCPRSSPESS